jgi:hypothetical protein
MDKTSAVVEYNVNGAKAVGKQAVNSALSTVKDSVLTSVTKAQGALQGLDVTQDLFKGQQKRSAKKVKKAQKKASKNVKNLQGAVQSGLSQTQDMLLAGLSTTQDAIDKNTKLASKSLKKAQKNITGTRNSLQKTLEKRARRRQRARTIFRLGILSGFVLVLLYTPWPGSEIRRQLLELWNGFFSSQEQ